MGKEIIMKYDKVMRARFTGATIAMLVSSFISLFTAFNSLRIPVSLTLMGIAIICWMFAE
jgi:hypothetical protein